MSIQTQERIMKTIKDAHKFTDGLINSSEQKSVHRDLLLNELRDLTVDKINVALFELKDLGKIEFDFTDNPNVIFVPK